MTRRIASTKSDAASLLERLSPEEALAVLHQVLDQHPELRSEAEQFATDLVSSPSSEDIAQEVHDRITGVDLEALNGRAGAHSWGYVEPSEAATELLEEEVEDMVEDMKRKGELGLMSAAEVVCAGIVDGLYRARDTKSDGALGWAVDFPTEEADHVVSEFVRSCPQSGRVSAQTHLLAVLAGRAPEWAEGLKRAAERAVRK